MAPVKLDPFPHQVRAIQHLVGVLQKHGVAIDGSDTGTGKTLTALWVAWVLKRRPLVVCPLAVRHDWEEAAAMLGVECLQVLNYEALRGEKSPYFRWARKKQKGAFEVPSDAIIIWDEGQKCKGYQTQASLMMKAAQRDAVLEWSPSAVPSLILSATLALSPMEMDAIGCLLGFHTGKSLSFLGWASSYGVGTGEYGPEFQGELADLIRLHKQVYPEFGIRVRVEEIPEFPRSDLRFERVVVDDLFAMRHPRIAQIMDEIAQKELEDYPSAVVQLVRERQKAEASKLTWLREEMLAAMNQGKSPVVMMNFRASLAALKELLAESGHVVDVIQGGLSPKKVQASVQAFQANQRQAILLQIDSGGVGISLHDKLHQRPRESLISPGWSAVALRQALGRIRRLQGTDVVQRLIAVSETPESMVLSKVQAKLLDMDTLSDGDMAWSKAEYRGLAAVRRHLDSLMDERSDEVNLRAQLQAQLKFAEIG